MAGKKRAKQFFQKHKNSASKKFWEKNRRKKMPKSFINIHTNIVTKKIGSNKHAKQFLQEHTNSASKNVGKKSSEKSAKNVFLYSHEYLAKKIRVKKPAKQFF